MRQRQGHHHHPHNSGGRQQYPHSPAKSTATTSTTTSDRSGSGGTTTSSGNSTPMRSISMNASSDHAVGALAATSVPATAAAVTAVDDADIAAGKLLTTPTSSHSHQHEKQHHYQYQQQQQQQPLLQQHHNGNAQQHQYSQQQQYAQHHHSKMNHNTLQMRSTSTSSSSVLPSAPSSLASTVSLISASGQHPSDLEFFDDMISDPVIHDTAVEAATSTAQEAILVLGIDITHLSRQSQFLVCAGGNFCFSLMYGYLQELISVELANRKLGLFLAMMQFSGYTVLAAGMRHFVYQKQQQRQARSTSLPLYANGSTSNSKQRQVPFQMYLAMSLLRAIDMGMTNLAMQYINYPAKTLMKSSKTVWTMIFGVVITRKVYKMMDVAIVVAMVIGLGLFMHADSTSNAVFQPIGVMMLTVSLICDGAIANMSEQIMVKYGVGQDEFIFRMYSIALIAITLAAWQQGDLSQGLVWLQQPGTYNEMMSIGDAANISDVAQQWSALGKIMIVCIFSAMGFFGSSCSAAITKNFGALTMSITSTARKATTLFLSFFLFHNVCTAEHMTGIIIFISSLTAKSLRRSRSGSGGSGSAKGRKKKRRLSGNPAKAAAASSSGAVGATTTTVARTTPERVVSAPASDGSVEMIPPPSPSRLVQRTPSRDGMRAHARKNRISSSGDSSSNVPPGALHVV